MCLWNTFPSVTLTARIVTGLPSYCSRSVLYFETGWETLAKRREKRKLTLLYKIKNGISPDYLSELLPPTIGDNMPYNLRHNNDIQIPYCRLNIYKNSFFPSTISRWNKLPLATRNSISVNQFKSRLNASYQNSNRSKFFLCGCRKLNVLHTKIRHGCSQLNSDLARINLKPNSSCTCGLPAKMPHTTLSFVLFMMILEKACVQLSSGLAHLLT